jgi:hypothetical protein
MQAERSLSGLSGSPSLGVVLQIDENRQPMSDRVGASDMPEVTAGGRAKVLIDHCGQQVGARA